MRLIEIIKPFLAAIITVSLTTGLVACDEAQSIVRPENPPSEQSLSKDQKPANGAQSTEKYDTSDTHLAKQPSLPPLEGVRGAGNKNEQGLDHDVNGLKDNKAPPHLKGVMKRGEALSQTHYGDYPLWSSNRRFKAHENAHNHYEKHGPDLGVKSYEDYIALSHGFIHNPPIGTEIINRSNGDKLFYNAELNIFAVATQKGAPRTLFRPDNGRAYWQKQKQIEAGRRTLKID
jgi:hypothetical protein